MTELLQKKATVTMEQPKVRRVCFVCTGNTCRSPMAEAVTNALAHRLRESLLETRKDSGVPSVEAFSAGLYAVEGDPIAENAIRALENAGIVPIAGHDYRMHTAHTLTAEDAAQFDLLIGLGGGHVMELMMRFPQLAQRITCMPKSIPDPFGGDLSTYAACLEEIIDGVKTLLFAGDAL